MTQLSPKSISLLCTVMLMVLTSLDLNTHLHMTRFKARTSLAQHNHMELQMAYAIHTEKN